MEEIDRERRQNKLKQQFQNKLGSVTNSIQAAGDNNLENSVERQEVVDPSIEKEQKELSKSSSNVKEEEEANNQNVFKGGHGLSKSVVLIQGTRAQLC